MSQSRYYEMETPLEYAIVHGRTDLHERLQKEGLPSEIGARMIWHEGPALQLADDGSRLGAGVRRSGRRRVRSIAADEAEERRCATFFPGASWPASACSWF